MVRLTRFRVVLVSTLTLMALVAMANAQAARPVGRPTVAPPPEVDAGSVAARRPALHAKDEGEFVHAISRARIVRPLGIDRA